MRSQEHPRLHAYKRKAVHNETERHEKCQPALIVPDMIKDQVFADERCGDGKSRCAKARHQEDEREFGMLIRASVETVQVDVFKFCEALQARIPNDACCNNPAEIK